jgi:hypothetical protein
LNQKLKVSHIFCKFCSPNCEVRIVVFCYGSVIGSIYRLYLKENGGLVEVLVHFVWFLCDFWLQNFDPLSHQGWGVFIESELGLEVVGIVDPASVFEGLWFVIFLYYFFCQLVPLFFVMRWCQLEHFRFKLG